MADALEVTVIGMAFVFGAILLLWGMMVLVMRLTPEVSAESEVVETAEAQELRKRAVAAAVAAALAQQARSPQPFPPPPTAIVSAWQAVLRSHQIKDRGIKR